MTAAASRRLARLLLLALAAASCGQHAGVHLSRGDASSGGTIDRTGEGPRTVIDDAALPPVEHAPATRADTGANVLPLPADPPPVPDTAESGVSGPAAAVGGPAPAGGNAAPAADDSGAAGRPRQSPAPPAGDRTGITDSTITIGMHAPLTGAAPVPAASVEAGKDQYWRAKGKIHGRTVNVIFKDDKFNPAAATNACKELIERHKVFLVFGFAGSDQVVACARVAGQLNAPYLSAGVSEKPLAGLDSYYTLSRTYARQAPLLVQWITRYRKPSNGKIGVIRIDTANLDDGIAAFMDAARAAGYTPMELRTPKRPSGPEKAQIAQWLAANQIGVAFPILAPADWAEIAKQPAARNTKWVGMGLTMGINTIAAVGCPEIEGAAFFSPWPGLNTADQLDPGFREAGYGDDFQWGSWGLNKLLHVAFERVGRELTRERFAAALEAPLRSGIWPNLAHTREDHFRVEDVHVVRVDCQARQWRSGPEDLFRSSF